MKKLLLLALLLLPASAVAPPLLTRQNTFTTTGTFSLPVQIGTGINLHKLIWYISGTNSACTILLQGSTDNSTWNTVITGTCTSGGVSSATTGVYNYWRLNLSAFTGTSGNASVTVTYAGYLDIALGSSTSGSANQVAFFDSSSSLTGDTGLTFDPITDILTLGTDVNLLRDGTNTLSLRNGVNPQQFRIYNTYTDATNFEAFSYQWAGNTLFLTVGRSGTGVYRPIILSPDGANTSGFTFGVAAADAMKPLVDNTHDFGSTSLRLRSGYFGTSIINSGSEVVNGTSLPAGYTFSVEAGTSRMNGRVYANNITTSGAAQTAYVCLSATGELIEDSTTCVVSSARFKHNIENMNVGLKEVLQMRPVQFYYNEAKRKNQDAQQLGFIAEEAEKIDTRFIAYDKQGLPYAFKYENYVSVLTKAIQEQQKQIEELRNVVNSLVSKSRTN